MYTLQRAVRSIHTSVQPPRLTKISLHPPKNVEVEFADGSAFHLSAEFLRVYSPAVDSKIRSVGGEKVIFGRSHVGIMSAEPVGNYGIRIVFDDLHNTGIYTWDYFYHLGSNKFTLMRNYVKTLKKHGLSRDPQRRKTRICFSQQRRLFFSSVKSVESRVDGLRKLKVVPATTLTAQNQEEAVVPEVTSTVEKEAVKNVLTLFLRKQGLTNAAATRTISKSDCFINYLVSRLHTIDKTRYLVGSELPILALEIRDAVVPYLESLLEEHGDILVDVMENFSNSPDNKGPIFQASPTKLPLDSKKLEVMDHPTSELRQSGILPPVTLYLLDIGMDVDQIKEVCRKYPSFVDFSLEKQIKRAVEFLLDLGMPQSDIPSFLCKAPHYCGSDPIPTFLYLENLGLDKGQLLEMLKRYPRIFECKRHDVKRIVDFLHELGLSTKDIVKVIGTMYPKVITYSVDDRLWPPVAEYFHSIGVNVPLLFFRYPMVFRYSVEHNIKPMTEFWLDNGFSMEEIRTMAVNGGFYFLRVKNNLRPKWDFFLTMGYPRSVLVKFPQYFGYSLEQNIKPRYERMMKRGVKLSLNEMLTSNDSDFEKSMNSWLKRKYKEQRPDAKNATMTTTTTTTTTVTSSFH